jgi:hypothetical protein
MLKNATHDLNGLLILLFFKRNSTRKQKYKVILAKMHASLCLAKWSKPLASAPVWDEPSHGPRKKRSKQQQQQL